MRVKLKEKVKEAKVVDNSTTNSKLDMVIAFDTTGSMRHYLDNVKVHVTNLVPKLFNDNPDLRLGIVAFGDYCDMESRDDFGKAYQVLDLTNDENKIIRFINEAQDTSGGDSDEFYELVIKKITEETTWRKDSTKVVLLIADACPHPIGYTYGVAAGSDFYAMNNQIDWEVEAKKASELGIRFDTLTINPGITWFNKLSAITGGTSLPFKNSSNTNELVRAATLAWGGERTRGLFKRMRADSMNSGDVELQSMYEAYSKIVGI